MRSGRANAPPARWPDARPPHAPLSLHARRTIPAAGDRAVEASATDGELPSLVDDSSDEEEPVRVGASLGNPASIDASLGTPDFFVTFITVDE